MLEHLVYKADEVLCTQVAGGVVALVFTVTIWYFQSYELGAGLFTVPENENENSE